MGVEMSSNSLYFDSSSRERKEAGVDKKIRITKAKELRAMHLAHQASFDVPKFSQQRFSGEGAVSICHRRVSKEVETEEEVVMIVFFEREHRRKSASLVKVTNAIPSRFFSLEVVCSSTYLDSKSSRRVRK